MIWQFDRLLTATTVAERVPVRFAVSAEWMAGILESVSLFERVCIHGHDGEILDWFPREHPDLCPLIPPEEEYYRQGAHIITAEAIRTMKALVRAHGISHYRGVPVVIDDTDPGFTLYSHPWRKPS
ncbi:MAG: hypothetical protein AB7P40_00405 [Chloroflexota bacterium]